MNNIPLPPRVESKPNPKFVAMLKGAREALWRGRGRHAYGREYICLSLPDMPGTEDLADLQEAIEDRLQGRLSFDGWLTKQGVPSHSAHEDDADGVFGTVSMQAARLRWIDQLIEEFGGTP